MARSGEFIQLISLLSQMADRRAQREQTDRQFSLDEQKFKSTLKQYEEQHQDKDVTEALSMLAKSSTEGRQALMNLYGTGHFSKDQMQALQQFAGGMPVSQEIMSAHSAQAGYDALTPDQRAVVDREAATRAATGMNQGQMGSSQLGAAFATGGAPPGQLGEAVSPTSWTGLLQNFAARSAQGYTPEQQSISQGQVELGWAGLRQEERKILSEAGVKELIGKSKGSLTPAETADAMRGIGNLFNDINNPKSDKAGNEARVRLIGQLSALLGLPPNYFVPQSGMPQVQPSAVPQAQTPFGQFFNGQVGNRVPSGVPLMPPFPGQPLRP